MESNNIGIKGAIKAFFILIIIFTVILTFWFLIKPSKSQNNIGIIPLPQDGILVPVDDSKCGTDIIECQSFDDCLQNCNVAGMTGSNYQCQKIEKDVFYLGTKLPKEKSYCLPSDGGSINNIDACGTYTGRVLRALGPDNKLGWVCECKYPGFYGNERAYCLQQSACSYIEVDKTTNLQQVKFAPLMKIDENGNPIKDKDGKTNIYYDPRTTEDSSPVDVYNKDLSKPVWTCECPPGYIKLPNDPYSCHRDPCYAGQGSSAAKYDPDKKECVCDDLTFKSNVTNFCYPLGLELEPCKPFSEPNENNEKLCSCGFCGTWITQDNNKEYGLIVKYESNIYIAYPSQDKDYCSPLLQIYPSDWLQSQNSNLYTTISSNQNKFANIKGSKLDDWFNIIGTIQIPDFLKKYPNITAQNILTFITDTLTKYSTVTDANQFLIDALNTTEILKKGTLPLFCNSSLNKKNTSLFCNDSNITNSSPLKNNYNPVGVVCMDYSDKDLCGIKAGAGTLKINPFDSKGYTCYCNQNYYLIDDGRQCDDYDSCVKQGEPCGKTREAGPCCSLNDPSKKATCVDGDDGDVCGYISMNNY